MYIVLSFLLSYVMLLMFGDLIKKYKKSTYMVTTILSILITYFYYSMLGSNHFLMYCFSPFVYGSFSTALFIMVMYLGISKKNSSFSKLCMPMRSEISIIACITTFIHNISMIFYVHHNTLRAVHYRFAAVVSLVLLVILIPLFITSFTCVKSRMKAKRWKKLQSLAYLFYVLVYVHILILNVPNALNGQLYYIVNLTIYSIIFLYYFVLKIKKGLTKK